MIMTPGSNAAVPAGQLTLRVLSGAAADASAFRLYASGKVNGDADMVFYGQPENDDRTISLKNEGNNILFQVELARLAAGVQKVAFTVTCDGGKTVAGLQHLVIQLEQNGEVLLKGPVELAGRQEAALILGELYRRNDQWKFRFIAQGFNGGLQPLAEHFGVDIAADAPAPAPVPAAKVSLSKVSLTKEKPAISLTKRDSFGEIRINLNWHRATAGAGGLRAIFGGNKGVDLDLGAFVELADGHKLVIQALGNSFGSMYDQPYVQLQGDDRTGDISNGEWLHINGQRWNKIREVMIFAFIYDGVASWDKTDGVVIIHMPDQPPIETRLTAGQNRRNMCAIARLVNNDGSIRVERINQFFKGHADMDQAFGWGFRWKSGSK